MSTTIESIHQLEAGIAALAEEDTAALSDAALAELIDQIAAMLSDLDAYVTRMANTVLARNFTVSDVPSNHDYSFRAGIFIGDYNNVAIGKDNQAWAFWTDARNGRSSRTQAGRNPACEQSDVWAEYYDARQGDKYGRAQRTDELFLVAQCPAGTRDRTNRDDDDDRRGDH